jgi:hypothetical protein
MPEAIWFVVERRHGDEFPTIVHDPKLPPRGGRGGVVYALRLDNHPDCASWARMRASQVYSLYRGILSVGAAPPKSVPDRPLEKQQTGRLLGEWWAQPKYPWRGNGASESGT